MNDHLQGVWISLSSLKGNWGSFSKQKETVSSTPCAGVWQAGHQQRYSLARLSLTHPCAIVLFICLSACLTNSFSFVVENLRHKNAHEFTQFIINISGSKKPNQNKSKPANRCSKAITNCTNKKLWKFFWSPDITWRLPVAHGLISCLKQGKLQPLMQSSWTREEPSYRQVLAVCQDHQPIQS